MRRTRVVVVAATLAALTTVAVPAAAAGSAPTPDPGKTAAAKSAAGATEKPGTAEKQSGVVDTDIVAAAAALGVTTDEMYAAMRAAKMSLINLPDPSPDDFMAAVAANLGQPLAQVRAALAAMFVKHEPDKTTDPVKKEPSSPLDTEKAAKAATTP